VKVASVEKKTVEVIPNDDYEKLNLEDIMTVGGKNR
jgi:hypothetical protein